MIEDNLQTTFRVAAMKQRLPPLQISRWALLGFVAAGAIVSISTTGSVSNFAGGFAAGAGIAFVVSRLSRPGDVETGEGSE
jgi:hypothetical protein